VLAINYGGRDEITRAVRKFAGNGGDMTNLREEDIRAYLDNPDIPDPDLIIRSAGEYRTSNFLLWEGAYSEFYISNKFWPDWDKEDLETPLGDYMGRDRRFGNIAGNTAGQE
jgi:undecaprenyl diphosphate synthase